MKIFHSKTNLCSVTIRFARLKIWNELKKKYMEMLDNVLFEVTASDDCFLLIDYYNAKTEFEQIDIIPILKYMLNVIMI